jgi:hypothetical protein
MLMEEKAWDWDRNVGFKVRKAADKRCHGGFTLEEKNNRGRVAS